ncbi:hypothetical protein BGZ95_009839, partial [Linnemannia exigua]
MLVQSGRYGGSSSGQGASGFGGGGGGGGLVGASSVHAGVVAPAKKKDPYATAWRTYSKIAEELQLLNPDGSLYPISKEAILKYLHHQSKRIKSSNLHWYVNGLKKHQENLGFPWDDVRYDEQVVGLLKELTLHPVMMGDSHGGGGGIGGGMGGMGDEEVSGAHASSALSKRKRDDFAFKKRRMPSSMSMEGDDNDEDDLQDDDFKDEDDDDLDPRRGGALHHHHYHDPDDSDDMEDSNRHQPLKRRASTGTLLYQARASVGQSRLSLRSQVQLIIQQHQRQRVKVNEHSITAQHQHSSIQHQHQHHIRSPSPDLRDGATHGHPQLQHHSQVRRDVGGARGDAHAADLTSSNVHHQRQHSLSMNESSDSQRFQHASSSNSSGGVDNTTESTAVFTHRASATPTATPAAAASTSTPTPSTPTAGKTTVHFTEVVECAQLLHAKYKNRCKDHPWGCVEITEDRHLELTMKMYLDWAGLVASERLTMDELPDLPEFRDIDPPRPLVGGTLKRMASTPHASSLASVARGGGISSSNILDSSLSAAPQAVTTKAGSRGDSEATTPTCTTSTSASGTGTETSFFGPYRSPSSSPQSHTTTTTTMLLHDEKDTPTSEDGKGEEGVADMTTRMSTASPPARSIPRPVYAMAQRSRPSSPDSRVASSLSSIAAGSGSGTSILARVRKMPSTPSLRQQHQSHEYKNHNHQLYRTDSTRSRHSQPPPQSPPLPTARPSSFSDDEEEQLDGDDDDVDDGDDDEEEDDDDDEDTDVNHYALSPWATAPASVLADARLRGSRNMSGTPTRRLNPSSSSGGTAADTSERPGFGDGEEEDAKKALPRSSTRDRELYDAGDADDSEEEGLETSAMVLDEDPDPESS